MRLFLALCLFRIFLLQCSRLSSELMPPFERGPAPHAIAQPCLSLAASTTKTLCSAWCDLERPPPALNISHFVRVPGRGKERTFRACAASHLKSSPGLMMASGGVCSALRLGENWVAAVISIQGHPELQLSSSAWQARKDRAPCNLLRQRHFRDQHSMTKAS